MLLDVLGVEIQELANHREHHVLLLTLALLFVLLSHIVSHVMQQEDVDGVQIQAVALIPL